MNSELKPKIRFKGFTDDWEQRELKDIGDILTGSTPSTQHEEYYSQNGMLWVTPTDIDSNIIKNTAKKLSDEGVKVARIVPANTILVTCIASIGKNALTLEKSSFNQQINSLTPYKEYNPYFILTESSIWSKKMKQQGASGMMQMINKNEFSELETFVPNKQEQDKIGKLFTNLDNLITLHQRKCDKLVELKKSLLEKMFPQNNSVIPEIRFKGFTNDWEQRKLKELCNIFDGTHQTPNYTDSGIMFLSVENIKDLKSEKYISYDDFKNNFRIYPEKNDILMTRIGDIGTTNIVKGSTLKAYYVSLALLKCKNINPYYLNFAIKSDFVQNGLKLRSLLTAIPMKINKDQIGEVDINYPINLEEQSNIGKIFDNIDNLITLHQCKYDKLNKIRQSLLNDMFI